MSRMDEEPLNRAIFSARIDLMFARIRKQQAEMFRDWVKTEGVTGSDRVLDKDYESEAKKYRLRARGILRKLDLYMSTRFSKTGQPGNLGQLLNVPNMAKWKEYQDCYHLANIDDIWGVRR